MSEHQIIKKNRLRSPNFTKNEIQALLRIVSGEKNVIESKKTDAKTWKEKDAAWERVCTSFNATSLQCIYRSKDSLRKLYDNRKKGLRRAALKSNYYESHRTSEGKDISADNDLLLSLVNQKCITELYNPYDSDSGLRKTIKSDESEPISLDIISDDEDHDVDGQLSNLDWDDCKPSHLKSRASNSLQSSKAFDNGSREENIENKEIRQPTPWYARRRPTLPPNLNATRIPKQNSELLRLKIQLANLELATMKRKAAQEEIHFKRRMEREQELHKFHIEAAKLEIALKRAELEKLV